MQPHEVNPNQQRHQHIKSHMGKHQCQHGHKAQRQQNKPVVDFPIEYPNGLVPGEVKDQPQEEEEEEDDHGDGVPEEAEEDDEEDDEGVVEAEVVEVAPNPGSGVRVAGREGDVGDGEEFAPRAAIGY
ncbi:hypothetical protein Dimus_021807 [Dionaea muscipula]